MRLKRTFSLETNKLFIMKILLKKIIIKSFKGIDKFETNLSDKVTIYGENETGKTSIANAMTWCLFGKDINDRADYQIMPLDLQNNMIPHKEPSVTLFLDLDGREKKFQRIMSQKWVKKRGEEESAFDGSCTTDYFVDDVPMKKKDYVESVNSIISEDLFRILTLPTYFPSIDWKQKREIITSIIGDADISSIAKREDFSRLIDHMNGKSIEDYRKMLAYQKKVLREEIAKIPASIEAAQEFIPESEPDYKQAEKDIQIKEQNVKDIDKKISDKSSVLKDYQQKIQERANSIKLLETSMKDFVEAEIKNKRDESFKLEAEKDRLDSDRTDKLRSIRNIDNQINNAGDEINDLKASLKSLHNKRQANKQKWIDANNEEFKRPQNSKCPTCGTMLEKTDDEIENMEADFNNRKANELEKIVESNKPLIEKCDKLENETIPDKIKEIENLRKKKETLQSEIESIEKEIDEYSSKIAGINIEKARDTAKNTSIYKEMQSEVNKLTIDDSAPVVDTSEYDAKKSELRAEINTLHKIINSKDIVDKARLNVEKYRKLGKEKSNQLANLEGFEYAAELFEKAIAEDVEKRINSRLTGGVTFKMFHKQNNGGLTPTCEILHNGVPYFSVNTASQVASGIIIINLLSEHYNLYAPVIIDNRESIINIPNTKCQIINLVVDKEYSSLTVVN